ncbi:uncharacterized protein VTP21DRAFT_6646 [Calcarisporiella thermophila]|uniref:uncharacterized protein n=1 Tax=Calcarisporiella thermophila TaxID=911321 RepID=UPI00374317F7
MDARTPVRILLVGMRRSGKTSIRKVVFHNLPPGDTIRLPSTPRTVKEDIVRSFLDFQLWDVSSQNDLSDSSLETTLSCAGALIFVIDALTEYSEALQRLEDLVRRAYRVNPNLHFEVFIHKVDLLPEDNKIETLEDIERRVRNDVMAEEGEEGPEIFPSLHFHLTSIYDHSIYEALSKVVQKLIVYLPSLESLLNMFCLSSSVEKAYLFDQQSKLYIATDSSPFDFHSYGICSDMIDVIMDIIHTFWLGMTEERAEEKGPESLDPNRGVHAVIKLQNNTILYLREVSHHLALLCLIRGENATQQSLFEYNVRLFRESVDEILRLEKR